MGEKRKESVTRKNLSGAKTARCAKQINKQIWQTIAAVRQIRFLSIYCQQI